MEVVGDEGGLCLLCFILPRPSKGGERILYRVGFTLSPKDFYRVFPKQKICWCALKWKWVNPPDVLTLFGSFHPRQVVFTSHSTIIQTTSVSWLSYGSNLHKKTCCLEFNSWRSPYKCTLVGKLKSDTHIISLRLSSSCSLFVSEILCVFTASSRMLTYDTHRCFCH